MQFYVISGPVYKVVANGVNMNVFVHYGSYDNENEAVGAFYTTVKEYFPEHTVATHAITTFSFNKIEKLYAFLKENQ